MSMTDEEWEAYKLRFSQQQGTVYVVPSFSLSSDPSGEVSFPVRSSSPCPSLPSPVLALLLPIISHEVPDLGTLAYRGGKKLFSKIRSLSSTSSTSASTSSSNNAASSPSPSPSPPPSINLPQQPDPLLLHLQNQHQHVRPGMGSPQLSHTPRSGSPPPPPFPRSSTAPHIVHLNPPQPPALVRSGSDTASSSSPPDSSYSGSIAEEEEEDEDEDDPELSAAEARLRARIAAGGSGSGEATPRRRSSFTGLSGMSGLEGGGGHVSLHLSCFPPPTTFLPLSPTLLLYVDLKDRNTDSTPTSSYVSSCGDYRIPSCSGSRNCRPVIWRMSRAGGENGRPARLSASAR